MDDSRFYQLLEELYDDQVKFSIALNGEIKHVKITQLLDDQVTMKIAGTNISIKVFWQNITIVT